MKNRKLIAVLAAAVLLAGCEEAPDNVVSKRENAESKTASEVTDRYESVTQEEAFTETIPVSQLKANDTEAAERIKKRVYENLKFADTFTVNAADSPELGVYEAERSGGLLKLSNDLFEAFFGEGFDPSEVTSETVNTNEKMNVYELDGIRMTVGDKYMYVQDMTQQDKKLYFSSSDKLLALYEITEGTQTDVMKLAEGEATIDKLKEKYSPFIQKLSALGIGLKPFTLSSQLNPTESSLPSTLLMFRSIFKKLPVFNFNYSEQSGKEPDFAYMLTTTDNIIFASSDKLFVLGIGAPYNGVKQKEKLDTVISPDRAAETASEQLAEYLDLTALRLDLVYVPIIAGGSDNSDKVEMTPYWLLCFDMQPLREHYAIINAVSEKVTYVEPKGV